MAVVKASETLCIVPLHLISMLRGYELHFAFFIYFIIFTVVTHFSRITEHFN